VSKFYCKLQTTIAIIILKTSTYVQYLPHHTHPRYPFTHTHTHTHKHTHTQTHTHTHTHAHTKSPGIKVSRVRETQNVLFTTGKNDFRPGLSLAHSHTKTYTSHATRTHKYMYNRRYMSKEMGYVLLFYIRHGPGEMKLRAPPIWNHSSSL
jgi:hypothetical protein